MEDSSVTMLMWVVGFVFTIASQGLGIIWWLDRKNDQRTKEMKTEHVREMATLAQGLTSIRQSVEDNHAHNAKEVTGLHLRVNEVKDTYVRKDDYREAISAINESLTNTRMELRNDITKGMESFSAQVIQLQTNMTRLLTDLVAKQK